MKRYALSRQARTDLANILNYSISQWGEEQGARYLRLIWKVIETVAERPERGRDYGELREKYRGIAAGSHMIFYRTRAGRIDILRILHQSMDFERHL